MFGHGGQSDGPKGGYFESNELDLSKETGDKFDRGQLQRGAWKNINFNFDKDASVAAFYGCNTMSWAEVFLGLQPTVKQSGGLMGKAGGTYDTKKFNQTYINLFGRKVYMRTIDEDSGTIYPVYYYIRGDYEGQSREFLKEHESWENLTITK